MNLCNGEQLDLWFGLDWQNKKNMVNEKWGWRSEATIRPFLSLMTEFRIEKCSLDSRNQDMSACVCVERKNDGAKENPEKHLNNCGFEEAK